jgi:hypothetical protein
MRLISGLLLHGQGLPFRLWRHHLAPDLKLPDPREAETAEYVIQRHAVPSWARWLRGAEPDLVPMIWWNARGISVRDHFFVEWNAVNQIDLVLESNRGLGLWFELRTPVTRRKVAVSLRNGLASPESTVILVRAHAEGHGAVLRPMSLRTRDFMSVRRPGTVG